MDLEGRGEATLQGGAIRLFLVRTILLLIRWGGSSRAQPGAAGSHPELWDLGQHGELVNGNSERSHCAQWSRTPVQRRAPAPISALIMNARSVERRLLPTAAAKDAVVGARAIL